MPSGSPLFFSISLTILLSAEHKVFFPTLKPTGFFLRTPNYEPSRSRFFPSGFIGIPRSIPMSFVGKLPTTNCRLCLLKYYNPIFQSVNSFFQTLYFHYTLCSDSFQFERRILFNFPYFIVFPFFFARYNLSLILSFIKIRPIREIRGSILPISPILPILTFHPISTDYVRRETRDPPGKYPILKTHRKLYIFLHHFFQFFSLLFVFLSFSELFVVFFSFF